MSCRCRVAKTPFLLLSFASFHCLSLATTSLWVFLSRELVTAVKPCIKALTYGALLPPSPHPLHPNTHPHSPFRHFAEVQPAPCSAVPSCSATVTSLSAADAVTLITDSFVCCLAAQRGMGIDQMPADWWLLNRLFFYTHGTVEGMEGGKKKRRRRRRFRWKCKVWTDSLILW